MGINALYQAIHSALEGVDSLVMSPNEWFSVKAFDKAHDYCALSNIEFWHAYSPRRLLLHKGTVYFDTSSENFPDIKIFKDV